MKSIEARTREVESTEREKLIEKSLEKQKYIADLNLQIKSDKERKKFDVIMSEHERRINDKQIKAYEQGDTSFAKVQNNLVPGLGQHYAKIQMQYLSK